VTALVGALMFMTATDSSATRKRPKKHQSFASFAADYVPPETFPCSYLETWDNIKVEDWVCLAGTRSTAILFDQMLDTNDRSVDHSWDGTGWKYLAAPKRFRCTIIRPADARTTDNYVCTYVDQGKKRTVPLSNTLLEESDDGSKWYLQRLPYPPVSPSSLSTP
jgi:hypothetical protein